MAVSIFVFCPAVRLRLASETVQAGFAVFPTFLVHSPCSPANSVPAANIPATANAMNLVIVQRETLAYAMSFKDLAMRRVLNFRFLSRLIAFGFQLCVLIG